MTGMPVAVADASAEAGRAQGAKGDGEDAGGATLLHELKASQAQALRATRDLRQLYLLERQRRKAATRITHLERQLEVAKGSRERSATALVAARRAIEAAIPCLEDWVNATKQGRLFKRDQAALAALRDALAKLNRL